jgi:Ca2+:H+ antiporter
MSGYNVGLETSDQEDKVKSRGNLRRGSVFGVRPWPVPTSTTYDDKKLFAKDMVEDTGEFQSLCSVGNVLWVVLFGWWVSLPLFLAAFLLMITFVGRHYARVCAQFGMYFLWPYGKCVVRLSGDADFLLTESRQLISSEKKSSSVGERFVYIIYMLISVFTIFPVMLLCMMFNWFFVVSIPMAKVLWTILDILIHNPTNVAILPDYSRAASFSVLLCNFRAFNVLYFEYEFKGVNIVFLNLIPIVLTRALMIVVHIFYHYDQGDNPILLFFIDLLCSIPITFYIGTSIASIAIQTNYTIGAILNAPLDL